MRATQKSFLRRTCSWPSLHTQACSSGLTIAHFSLLYAVSGSAPAYRRLRAASAGGEKPSIAMLSSSRPNETSPSLPLFTV